MKNYSKQREAILEALRCTDTHPTANWIYEKVRETLPNISLGTVYRNHSDLSKSGEILSLHVADGLEHFDYVKKSHAHLHCKVCGAIWDAELKDDHLRRLSEENGFTAENTVYVVYGICKNCKTKN